MNNAPSKAWQLKKAEQWSKLLSHFLDGSFVTAQKQAFYLDFSPSSLSKREWQITFRLWLNNRIDIRIKDAIWVHSPIFHQKRNNDTMSVIIDEKYTDINVSTEASSVTVRVPKNARQ